MQNIKEKEYANFVSKESCIILHEESKRSRLLCKHCKKEFHSFNLLKMHFKTHHQVKSLKCGLPECSKRFSSMKGLNNHSKLHSGFASYKCKICEKAFVFKKECHLHNWEAHHISSSKDSNSIANSTICTKTNKRNYKIANSIFVIEKVAASKKSSKSYKTNEKDLPTSSQTSKEQLQYFDFQSIFYNVSSFVSCNRERIQFGDTNISIFDDFWRFFRADAAVDK